MQLSPISLAITRLGGVRFSPAALFPSGVQGAWYDPSDASTLFEDTAGTTPSPTPGAGALSVVGKMLDKSGNGNHAIRYGGTTTAPELSARVNLLNATATLSTQSVTTQATNYTLYFTGSGSITLSGTATGTYTSGTNTITCTAGTLTLTVSGTVTTADLRPANIGTSVPSYQAVTSTYTYDSNGFPRYLVFNGTASGMYTPANLNLSGTDKATVFDGFRKLSNTAQQVVYELSANVGSNNGAFLSVTNTDAAGGTSNASQGIALRGTSTVIIQATSLTAPISTVDTAVFDIAASTNKIIYRVNGAQAAASGASSVGTGNLGTYPLFIGSRNNASLFLNGYLYSLIVVGAASTAAQISSTESWINGKEGGVY